MLNKIVLRTHVIQLALLLLVCSVPILAQELTQEIAPAPAVLAQPASNDTADAGPTEFSPVRTLSVPPMTPPAVPPQGVPPLPPPGRLPARYAVSDSDHEWLQKFALTDRSAPPTDEIVPIRASSGPAVATVTTSFPGLDYPASLNETPDTTVAKSGNRVLEATNGSLRLFTLSGSVLATTSTASLFGLSRSTTDPKVFFDFNSAYRRFILLVEDYPDFNAQDSNLYLAVSRTPNPTDFSSANWCTYWLGGPQTINGVRTWYDSPIFGVGADTLVFTTTQADFSFYHLFQGVIVNAGDKNQIENNAASCPWIGFYVYVPTPTNDTTFALMPTQHYTSPSSFAGTTNPVYMVSTHGLKTTETSSTIYRVWRIRNSGSSLEELDLNLNTYSTPPKAPQPTVPNNILDEGDVRVKQIAGIGDSLWLTHGLTCNVGGSNQGCIRVMRLDIGQDPGGHVTASVGQSVLFSGPAGAHYWMPAIAANSAQSTVVVFLNSSATTYLSSAFTTKSSTDAAYPAATTLLAGGCTGNSDGGRKGDRTGDYQGAQTDQNDRTSFWIAGEATPAAGQCSSVWLTQIANVTP